MHQFSTRSTLLLLFFFFLMIGFNFSQEVVHVPVWSSRMVFASNVNKVFAYGRIDGDGDQMLYEVDAFTGETKLVNLNLEITDMAISADGSLLYLGVNSLDSGIVVINVPSMTIAKVFSLRASQTEGEYNISDMEVSPNDPTLLAVLGKSTLQGEYERHLRIFDNGIVLPNYFEGRVTISSIKWSDEKPVIYGTSQYSFVQIPFDQQGAYTPDTVYATLDRASDLILYDDKLYSGGGLVIEEDKDFPVQYGEVPEFGSYTFFIDELNNRLCRVRKFNDSIVVNAYDPQRLSNLDLKWNIPIPGSTITSLISLGPGPAFIVSTQENIIDQHGLFIVRLCDQIPAAPLLDPAFNELIVLCTQPDKQIVVHPPGGYDFIIDQDGHKQDSIIIDETGSFTYRVMDANGCISKPSEFIHTTKGSIPAPPVIEHWNGLDLVTATTLNLCQNGKTYLYAPSVATSSTHWSTGYIGDTYYTDYTGSIWATCMNKEGCVSEKSNVVQINTSAASTPEPPEILSDGGFNFCINHGDITLKAGPGYTQYHWIYDNTHREDSQINIHSFVSKGYSLRGKDANGCWSDFNTIELNYPDYSPSTPQITQQINKLAATLSAFAYEWFKDDVPIPDSDTQVLTVTSPGAYQVRMFDGVCWSKLSFKKIIP